MDVANMSFTIHTEGGLRQGDPLSTLLFALFQDGAIREIYSMLQNVVDKSGEGAEADMALFVDDTSIFVAADSAD
eukprot:12908459-Prorocentrum_lima.AAC.1